MFEVVPGIEYADRGDYVVYENKLRGSVSLLDIAIIVEFTLNDKLVVRKFCSTEIFMIEISQVVNIDRRSDGKAN